MSHPDPGQGVGGPVGPLVEVAEGQLRVAQGRGRVTRHDAGGVAQDVADEEGHGGGLSTRARPRPQDHPAPGCPVGPQGIGRSGREPEQTVGQGRDSGRQVMPGRRSSGVRVALVAAAFALLAGACTSLGPSAADPPTPIGPPTVPVTAPPATLTPVARPSGAATPGTTEWYSALAPSGRKLTLGVYRPEVRTLADENAGETGAGPVTVLVLHGGDGFRRLYEDLARRYASRGFVAIAGCWFERTEQPANADAVDCHQGPVWKGMNVVVGGRRRRARQCRGLLVPGVDPDRLVIAGHSYGAGVALLRASAGHTEPVISSSGFLAPSPLGSAVPLPTDDVRDRPRGEHPRARPDHALSGGRTRLHHTDGPGPGARGHAHRVGQPAHDDLLPEPRRVTRSRGSRASTPLYTNDATSWIHAQLP